MQRFAPDGALRVQIEGDELRHYPDTDTLEIDDVRIRAIAPDGRRDAGKRAPCARNGDASEVQLLGGAPRCVRKPGRRRRRSRLRSEFLHAFLDTERVRSHLPVWVRHGATEVRADGARVRPPVARVLQFNGQRVARDASRRRTPQGPAPQ